MKSDLNCRWHNFIVYNLRNYVMLLEQLRKKDLKNSDLGPVSRASRELFGPEKPFVKLRPAYSVKLIFSHVVKRIKTKIMAKFRASRRLRFEDPKRIMSPRNTPEKFRDFWVTGPRTELEP